MRRNSVNASPIVACVAFVATLVGGSGYSLAQTAIATEEYNQGISIRGTERQRELIRAHLDSLAKLPTGKKLLAAIEAAATDGKRITIQHGKQGDAYVQPDDWAASVPKRHELVDGVVRILEPGRGSASTLSYDPHYKENDAGGEGGVACMTEETILGHELIHGLHALQGRILADVKWVESGGNEVNYEERITSGFGGVVEPDGFTENALRAEQSIALRVTYARLCEATGEVFKGIAVAPRSRGLVESLSRAGSQSPAAQPTRRTPRGGGQPTHSSDDPAPVSNGISAAQRARLRAEILNSPLGE